MKNFKLSILLVLAVIVTDLVFVSCETESDSLSKTTKTLYEVTSDLSTVSYKEDMSFYIKKNQSGEEVKLDLNVNPHYLHLSQNSKNSKNTDDIIIDVDGVNSFTLSNFEKVGEKINYRIGIQDGQFLNLMFNNPDGMGVDDLKQSLIGDFAFENFNIATQKTDECPPCVVVVVGAVTVAINHCTDIVTEGIKNCTTGCYTAEFCSVDCHACQE